MKENNHNMTTKVNIVLLGNFLYPYGMAATRRKQQFIDFFKEQGAEVKVLILYQGSNKTKHEKEIEGWHKGVYYKILSTGLKNGAGSIFYFPVIMFKACCLISRWKIKKAKNVILSFGFDGLVTLPFIWAKTLGFKIIFDIVEDFSLTKYTSTKQRLYFLSGRLIRFLFLNRIIDGVSVISRYLENKYRKDFKGKVVLLPISASVQSKNLKSGYNNPVIFLYAGTFSEKDGLELLLPAFEVVNSRFPNTKLLLTGHASDKRLKEISSLIRSPQIELKGLLPEDQFYRTLMEADILLMTRVNSEFANAGFPYKVGEYLATGNTVIATDVSDISYYLENKKDALIIEPGNEAQLIEAMTFCLENEDLCLQIGKKGQETCAGYFNPSQNSKILFDLMIEENVNP
jgi:glycosyltransferase involved in cell wall biosynthesis